MSDATIAPAAPLDTKTPVEAVYQRAFLAGAVAITLFAAWLRALGLSHGSLYRDDAWVALTRRVPLAEAWRMVGTAPGFVMFERFWTGLSPSNTWFAQLPVYVVAVLAIPLVIYVARWWGLGRWSSLLVGMLLALGRINIAYATHLKPYAHDLVAGTLILWMAERWRRGNSAWLFALVSLAMLAVSFTSLPLVVGCGVVILVEAVKSKRLGALALPAMILIGGFSGIYFLVRKGISPRLKDSWSANFFDWHSVGAFVHSTNNIWRSLVWGFADTSPHWHLAGYSKFVLIVVVVTAVVAITQWQMSILPVAGVVSAVVFALAHQAPLGTGRTDAYLYPALALIVAIGVDTSVRWLRERQRIFVPIVIAVVVTLMSVTAIDVARHRPVYPGGDITPVAVAANDAIASGGGVVIEGTARWPWTYYEVKNVRLIFSPLFNTGFAPLSDNPAVVIMPGTKIEGAYHPNLAVERVAKYCSVLYVRTDDWVGLGDPLAAAFAAHHFHQVSFTSPPGYLLVRLQSSDCIGNIRRPTHHAAHHAARRARARH